MTYEGREGLSHVPDARFDPQKGCLGGTRKEIIDLAIDWTSSLTTPLVLWICGQAGMGKTTIVHSMADALKLHRCLAGSFFFSRAVQAHKHPTSYLPQSLTRCPLILLSQKGFASL